MSEDKRSYETIKYSSAHYQPVTRSCTVLFKVPVHDLLYI